MTLSFDETTASHLMTSAQRMDNLLRDETVLRSAARDNTLALFSGPYFSLFQHGCQIEESDRYALARTFDHIAGQTAWAIRAAQMERERLDAVDAWTQRKHEREHQRATDGFFGGIGANTAELFDPSPDQIPVPIPTLEGRFIPRERPRTGTPEQFSQTVSADPEALRVFVTYAREAHGRFQAATQGFERDWALFQQRCSWVRLQDVSFLLGLHQFLHINQVECNWIEQIATAFENAGSGATLTVGALNFSGGYVEKISDQTLLDFAQRLPPAEFLAVMSAHPGRWEQFSRISPESIHSWWMSIGPEAGSGEVLSTRQRELLTGAPERFGNLEGLPYHARHLANTTALKSAIAAATETVKNPEATQEQRDEAQKQLTALVDIQDSLDRAPGGEPRSLISLVQDHPPLAAVSIGNLDTATSVTYAVPGKGTTTENMSGWTNAAQNIGGRLPAESAVVAWIGYHTPDKGPYQVLTMRPALVGGQNLARSMTGLSAVRGGTPPDINVVAHSYGSTAAAVALTQPGVHVKSFITLGSAGLPDSVHTASDLHADAVYAGNAKDVIPSIAPDDGDQWAWVGRDASFSHHVNPMSHHFGARTFGVDTGGDTGRRVTTHDAQVSDSGPQAGYLDAGTESLANLLKILTGATEKITPVVIDPFIPMEPYAPPDLGHLNTPDDQSPSR